MVNYLLRNYNANPNVQQLEKKIPVLQFAVALQLYDIIDLLLQAGADPNMTDFQGQTALHIAALIRPPTAESLKIVDRLIKNREKKADVNAVDHMARTVLHAATFNEAEDIVKRLLECQPHIEVDKKEKDREITPLHLAAWKNSKNITKMLINQGKARVDVRDKNGDTPLEYAASSNAIDVAELLLQAMTSMAKTKRWKKRSPLHVAAAHNALQVGELLISKDADIHARDDLELTPLHYAKFHGHDKFIELLCMKDNVSFTADPPVSKPLTPDELRSVHQLTNGFRLQNPSTIQIDLILPSIAQFNNFKLKITQELIIDGFQSNFR
jgi:ankyrin repeat protein